MPSSQSYGWSLVALRSTFNFIFISHYNCVILYVVVKTVDTVVARPSFTFADYDCVCNNILASRIISLSVVMSICLN